MVVARYGCIITNRTANPIIHKAQQYIMNVMFVFEIPDAIPNNNPAIRIQTKNNAQF